MALVVNDRVRETSTTTGTGTFTLAGAQTGFETFSTAIGNTNTTYYAISNQANGEFEVGLGTVGAGTLARTTIISSSNSDSAVDFSAGTKDVFCTLPASKAVILDSSGNIVANNGSNLTNLNADNLASGTVPDARFPATLPAANGSALTDLNATNLASGTVPDARFPATLPAVSGANLTNLDADDLASGTVPDARFPATLPALNGSALTALNASNVASGTLASDRLPTVPTTKGGTGLTAIGTANQVLAVNGAGTALEYQTPTTGDITGVTAGSGLTGGGTTGDVTLNVGAGTGVTVNADDIAIGQDVATSASPTFAGLTTTADINFGDNDKAVFGAGSDLQIFHDGSNSLIQDVGTGKLIFRASTQMLFQDNDGSESYAKFNDNGSVELYYDNAKKFETTLGGATVTGTMAATTFSGSGASLTSIPNGALDNSAITINGTSTSLGGSINVGDITGVTAGNGLTGGGSSGAVTLNVGAGTGIDVAADTIAVDVSDFMTNGSNNRIVTATGTDGMNAEANLTFDGSDLTVTGDILPGANDTYDLGASGNVWRNIYTGDLHLSNEAKSEGNSVDGTKGNWTIQEGAEDLYILNNKSGKKYRFKLEEM